MGRRGLIGVAAAGAVVAVIGASGVLATFSDRATTGSDLGQSRERITSDSRSREIDIVIADYDNPVGSSDYVCGTFTHDRTTGIFATTVDDDEQLSDLGSPLFPNPPGLCVKNVGERPIASDDLSIGTFAVTQGESACTGDEGVLDPEGPSCGTVGEALGSLFYRPLPVPCGDYDVPPFYDVAVPLTSGARVLGTSDVLEPQEVACFTIVARYDPPTLDAAVIGQSDIVRWRFRLQADDGA